MTAVSDRLDAIQKRLDTAVPGAITITPSDVAWLRETARKQQAAIDAVRALHVPVIKDGAPVGCSACDWEHPVFSFRALWPCPTVLALEAKP